QSWSSILYLERNRPQPTGTATALNSPCAETAWPAAASPGARGGAARQPGPGHHASPAGRAAGLRGWKSPSPTEQSVSPGLDGGEQSSPRAPPGLLHKARPGRLPPGRRHPRPRPPARRVARLVRAAVAAAGRLPSPEACPYLRWQRRRRRPTWGPAANGLPACAAGPAREAEVPRAAASVSAAAPAGYITRLGLRAAPRLGCLRPQDALSPTTASAAAGSRPRYPDSWYRDITSNKKFFSLAATYRGAIVGMIVAEIKSRTKIHKEDGDILASTFSVDTQVAYILSLGVVKEFRKHGIGSLLLESLKDHISTTAQDHCKAIYLHVLTTNNTAINFYENRDFKQHHYLPYYYSIRGVLKDGFTYVLYINGGHPPWTILDYIQHLGSALANLSPCSIPHRIYRQAHSLLCSFLPWSSISTKGGIEYSRTM
uniref:N-alpha-acetyltransferase 60 n=2 Tax=Canis lupus familiaris TaxID=9615 RepID=A0A8C0SVZ8_CANLF